MIYKDTIKFILQKLHKGTISKYIGLNIFVFNYV